VCEERAPVDVPDRVEPTAVDAFDAHRVVDHEATRRHADGLEAKPLGRGLAARGDDDLVGDHGAGRPSISM
jgi:hypothetical protein